MQYSFVTHTRHNVVKNNFSINLVKIRIKTEYVRMYHLKNRQNPYRIRVIRIMWHVCEGQISGYLQRNAIRFVV